MENDDQQGGDRDKKVENRRMFCMTKRDMQKIGIILFFIGLYLLLTPNQPWNLADVITFNSKQAGAWIGLLGVLIYALTT